MRNVAPQRVLKENVPAVSQLVPATADFKALTSDHPEGVVTRFMQDRLEIVFWLKPPAAAGMIFGCLVSVDALTDLWRDALPENASPDYVLALLNDKGAAGRDPAAGRNGARLETAVCRLGNRRSAAALGSGALSHAPAAAAGKRAQRAPHPPASDRGRPGGDRLWRLGGLRGRAPPAGARAKENRFRFQRFARTQDAAHFDPDVRRDDAKRERRPRRSARNICASSWRKRSGSPA